jgi:hypothetical protein
LIIIKPQQNIEEQQQQVQEEMVLEATTIMEAQPALNVVDGKTVVSDPSHQDLICLFLEFTKIFNSYPTSSLTLAKNESVILRPLICIRTSQSKKLRWLETLSHQQKVVPCDVVSTG